MPACWLASWLAVWLVCYIFTCIHVQTIAERHENVKHGSIRQSNSNSNSNGNNKKYCEKYRCKRCLKQVKKKPHRICRILANEAGIFCSFPLFNTILKAPHSVGFFISFFLLLFFSPFFFGALDQNQCSILAVFYFVTFLGGLFVQKKKKYNVRALSHSVFWKRKNFLSHLSFWLKDKQHFPITVNILLLLCQPSTVYLLKSCCFLVTQKLITIL